MENKNNKIITKQEVIDILNTYSNISDSYLIEPPYNISHYQIAFANKCFYEQLQGEAKYSEYSRGILERIFKKNNETYETVGDSLIASIIVSYLEERFDTENEGFISILKIDLTKTDGLAYFAKSLKFSEYILLSSNSEKETVNTYVDTEPTIGRNNNVYLENCFESFIGALFIDFKTVKGRGYAYDICYKFIESLLDNTIDFSQLILKKDNFKIILQNLFHRKSWKIPTYEDIDTKTDKNDKKIYTRGIYLNKLLLNNDQLMYLFRKYKQTKLNQNKIIIGIGESYKKRLADQICAKECILLLEPNILDCDISLL